MKEWWCGPEDCNCDCEYCVNSRHDYCKSPQKMIRQPDKPKHNYVWYSFCSVHGHGIEPQCVACHSGYWIDENNPEFIADQELFRADPDLWQDKHNPCACPTCSGYCACRIKGHHRWEKRNES